MANVEMKNISGKSVGTLDLDDAVFAEEMNEHLLWEVVKWQRARWRKGCASTKTRGEIRGSTKRIGKQKGSGNARHGPPKVNIFVGGGDVFGPKPRDYSYSMPKKARKKALRSALSLRLQENKLVVLDEFPVEDGKTKTVVNVLGKLGVQGAKDKVLIVDSKDNQLLVRGAKNLETTKWLAPEGLNVYDVLNHPTLVMTKQSVETVQNALRA